MGRARHRHRRRERPIQAKGWFSRRRGLVCAAVLVVAAGVGLGLYLARHREDPTKTAAVASPLRSTQRFQSLDELLKLPADQLKDVDIAEMNLLCAKGLPGAEKLDIGHALATLDKWARRVAFETNRHLYRVTDPRWRDTYRRSEAYLRAYMLLQVLQQDLGVKYDMAAAHNFAFNDSRVAFIHGMIPAPGETAADTRGGTCASMPVMYVAVGRRLGYPLFVVATKGHLFARWDGKDHPIPAWRERFNIEGSGDGFGSYDDSYYKTWPFKITDAEVKVNGWLVSLSPTQQFAAFLVSRGHCAIDNGQPMHAARCYENACGYDPAYPAYPQWFADAAVRCDYRPVIPALIALLERRRRPSPGPEEIISKQRADELARMREGRGDAGMMGGIAGLGIIPGAGGSSPVRVGQWQSQPRTPGIAPPYAPQVLQPGLPQPTGAHVPSPPQVGIPGPYEPRVPGRPPNW